MGWGRTCSGRGGELELGDREQAVPGIEWLWLRSQMLPPARKGGREGWPCFNTQQDLFSMSASRMSLYINRHTDRQTREDILSLSSKERDGWRGA